MKTQNTLYKDLESLTAWLESNNLDSSKHCHISIHTSVFNEEEAVKLAKEIKKLAPHAQVNGCSTSGVIYLGDIYDDETLISLR